jgi:hypothetical protein
MTVHRVFFGVAIGALALSLIGCGGSGTPAASPSGTSGSVPGSSPTSSPVAALPAAPSGLVASNLLASVSVSAALHTRGAQDDGGVSTGSTTFVSQAVTQSRLTVFTVMLTTYDTPANATQSYQQLAVQGSKQLPGVGDAAAYQPATQVTVRKGAQVLTVRVAGTTAGNNVLASQGKNAASLQQVLDKPLLAAARAIAPHLSGQSVTGQYVEIPRGGADPCAIPVAALQAKLHKSVSLSHAASESPPAQQCDYTIDGKPYIVQTFTAAQARSAIPRANLRSIFTADRARGSQSGTLKDTAGPFTLFMNPDADWTAEVLLSGPRAGTPGASTQGLGSPGVIEPAGYRQPTPPEHPAPLILVKVANGYTFVMDYDDCYELFYGAIGDDIDGLSSPVFQTLGPAAAAAAVQKVKNDIHDWCSELAKAAPSQPQPQP